MRFAVAIVLGVLATGCDNELPEPEPVPEPRACRGPVQTVLWVRYWRQGQEVTCDAVEESGITVARGSQLGGLALTQLTLSACFTKLDPDVSRRTHSGVYLFNAWAGLNYKVTAVNVGTEPVTLQTVEHVVRVSQTECKEGRADRFMSLVLE